MLKFQGSRPKGSHTLAVEGSRFDYSGNTQEVQDLMFELPGKI
jgi:hypothetical protein